MKTENRWVILLLLMVAIITGCEEEPVPEPEPGDKPAKEEAPALTQKINNFIKDAMDDVYLWYKELPDIDTRYEMDSEAYFNKLLYTEDKWSFVTDDIKSLEDSFEGVEKSYGWSLAFGRFSDTQTIFALVEFVYPNTPASEAGFKRGDMIFKMNDADIVDENYRDLLSGNSISVSFGQYIIDQGISNVKNVSLTARELNLNPILVTSIIEDKGHKIGYLFYAQFIANYNTSLDTAFQYFQDEGITDLVVDLRYNPGGYTSAAQHFCSSIAPVDVVTQRSTLVTFQWNDKYQEYWTENNVKNQLEVNFLSSAPVKLGLNKLHVLTGSGTASASELSITGLKPYMDVTTVGETTYGKYTASITLKPEDFYQTASYYEDFDNWGIQPIVIRYANSQGVTDFKDGFIPNIEVEDDLWSPTPLGDKREALLKAAIDDITGTQVSAVKSTRKDFPYSIFDRGFSKFDANKREMIFDKFEIK